MPLPSGGACLLGTQGRKKNGKNCNKPQKTSPGGLVEPVPRGYHIFMRVQSDLTKSRRRNRTALILLSLTVIVLAFLCLFVGSSHMTLAESFAALFKKGSAAQVRIIWNIRIPRVLAAIFAGGGFVDLRPHHADQPQQSHGLALHAGRIQCGGIRRESLHHRLRRRHLPTQKSYLAVGSTDCHTSDIGHWFAMTNRGLVLLRKADTHVGLSCPALGERQAVSRLLNLNISCSAISFRISVSIRSRNASSSSGSNCVPRPRIISPRIVSGGKPLR